MSIATYNRPAGLAALLTSLERCVPVPDVDVVIVVVDNSPEGNACRDVGGHPAEVVYVHEPEAGIVAARNRGLETAITVGADVVIFVDDDETVSANWLAALMHTWRSTGADVVTGPVRYLLPPEAASHLRDVPYFAERAEAHGSAVVDVATNNTLLSMTWIEKGARFDPTYSASGGSDKAFFLALHRAGASMVWCEHAQAYESVPANRATEGWVLARDRRNGQLSARLALEVDRKSRIGLWGFAAGKVAKAGVLAMAAPVAGVRVRFQAKRTWHSARGWLTVLLQRDLFAEYGRGTT